MTRLLQFIVFLAVPLVNYALAFSQNGQQFDDDPLVLISPAGYAFAIWGPIFLGMIYYSYVVWKKLGDDAVVNRSTWAGISAGLASIAFVPISLTNMQWLVMVNILWHLISLIYLYKYNQSMRDRYTSVSRWVYLGPQMYLGWISAATTISVALALREAGVQWEASFEVVLTCGLLVILGMVAGYLALRRGMVISLVVIWALIGILVEQGDIGQIRYTALVVIAGLITLLISLLRKDRVFI